MKQNSLPPEFSGLEGKVSYVQRVSATEYSSSCPRCLGELHKNGDFPDRFRMWTNANGKNKIMGWCRRCSYVWFPKHDKPMSPEEFEKWRKEQIEVEERRKREAEQALKLLRSEKLWEFYHREMNEWGYQICSKWGIPRENVEFWRLGMIKDYVVRPDGYHSPAITIPCWGFDGQVQNIKVRVLNPQSGKDRYRSLYKLGREFLFVARPDIKSVESCLLVEGEKKAMVCAGVKQDIQVVGAATVTPSAESLRELAKFAKIYLCLDPDSRVAVNGVSPLKRAVDILGKERVKVVNLPGKVDDMILKNGLSLESALRYA